MRQDKKIERLEDELIRLREKIDSLQKENSALKEALEDKEKTIAEMNNVNSSRESTWEQHITDVSEAIEEAYEAKLAYEEAAKECASIKKEYKRVMDQLVGMLKQTVKGKAV